MYTRTLAQLRTSLLIRGSYENSADITAAVALEILNDAIEETYGICIASGDDYYVRLGSQFATVAGQASYALPTDFYELRKVEIQRDSVRWARLRPIALDAADMRATPVGYHRKYRYRLSTAGLTLDPVPQSVDQLRIYYVPLAPQLAIDSDQVTFDRPVEQKLVLHIALRDCYQRQDLATDAIDMKIAQLSKQLRTAADTHDDGEPFYLNARGPSQGLDDEGCW